MYQGYYITKTISWIAFILFYIFFYIELCLNILGRETAIIWLCGNLITFWLVFYMYEWSWEKHFGKKVVIR